MVAFDFVMYCAGVSMVVLAFSGAVRVIISPRRHSNDHEGPSRVPVPDPVVDAFSSRLQAIQEARYSSPIVRRQLDPNVGPVSRVPTVPRSRVIIRQKNEQVATPSHVNDSKEKKDNGIA
jgi:hypothetical protein